MLFPFDIPIYAPAALVRWTLTTLRRLRIIGCEQAGHDELGRSADAQAPAPRFKRLRFPLNFITAPLIADLFLLAIEAIGRDEVYGGTVGSNNIAPIGKFTSVWGIQFTQLRVNHLQLWFFWLLSLTVAADIMAFFLTLAYIAISIDASGLIRYLAFRVLSWGGEVGHRLFFYLYAFFFLLGSFIGNDPIILSGTAFLAYMTRVSNNIEHPRAWIHTQFAIANIASAILVSSNPTNLVLAGAFNIKFIDYTANMVVPVVVTAIVLFPCLLYIIFAHERLIPLKITMHELPDEIRTRKPINPNIPNARGNAEEAENENLTGEQGKLLSLEEIMNPFLDKGGALFGAVVMTGALVAVLVLNAASQSFGEHPVYYVTLPAAFVMFCWDLGFGWLHRHETREIARKGKQQLETVRTERSLREQETESRASAQRGDASLSGGGEIGAPTSMQGHQSQDDVESRNEDSLVDRTKSIELTAIHEKKNKRINLGTPRSVSPNTQGPQESPREKQYVRPREDEETANHTPGGRCVSPKEPRTLVSLIEDAYRWCQETFPTVAAVFAHLPFALVPFALTMFVLVEALVTKGWVPVFAYGWDHWVQKTGTVGAVGGMGFLSVILCNVSKGLLRALAASDADFFRSSPAPTSVPRSCCHAWYKL